MPMAETKGGATRGRRNAFFQKFLAGNVMNRISVARGTAMILEATVTEIARRILLIKLSLTTLLAHTLKTGELKHLLTSRKGTSPDIPGR